MSLTMTFYNHTGQSFHRCTVLVNTSNAQKILINNNETNAKVAISNSNEHINI